MTEIDCDAGCDGYDAYDDYFGAADSEVFDLSGVDEETGLIKVHMADEEAMVLIKGGYSESSMMTALTKILVLLHHNAAKCHEFNKQIEKVLIKVETNNVVKSFNGYTYLAFQTLGGLVNLTGGVFAMTGEASHKLVGKVADVRGYEHFSNSAGKLTSKGMDNAQAYSRQVSKVSKQFSQPCQVAASIADNSGQALRQEGMGNKQSLDTQTQETGRRSGGEEDNVKTHMRMFSELRNQKTQVGNMLMR